MVGKAAEDHVNKRWFGERLHAHGECVCRHTEAAGTHFWPVLHRHGSKGRETEADPLKVENTFSLERRQF